MAQPQHISIGRLGEDIVTGYLLNRGYLIVARNYWKKCGELDIVAKKDSVLHFVEVKAGSWHRDAWPEKGADVHRPEDHFDQRKRVRMDRTIQSYLIEQCVPQSQRWTVDLAVVLVNAHTHKARLRWMHDLLLR